MLDGEGEYNLNDVKEIVVTDSYLALEKTIRGCQGKDELLQNKEDSLPLCSGLVVSSYTKSEAQDSRRLSSTNIRAYDNYMQWSKYPPGMKGDILTNFNKLLFCVIE